MEVNPPRPSTRLILAAGIGSTRIVVAAAIARPLALCACAENGWNRIAGRHVRPTRPGKRCGSRSSHLMSKFAYYGFWACAGAYAMIGIVGVILLGAQPGIAYSNDGYGTVQPAADK